MTLVQIDSTRLYGILQEAIQRTPPDAHADDIALACKNALLAVAVQADEPAQSISHWGMFEPKHEPEVLEARKRFQKLLHPVCHTIVDVRV